MLARSPPRRLSLEPLGSARLVWNLRRLIAENASARGRGGGGYGGVDQGWSGHFGIHVFCACTASWCLTPSTLPQISPPLLRDDASTSFGRQLPGAPRVFTVAPRSRGAIRPREPAENFFLPSQEVRQRPGEPVEGGKTWVAATPGRRPSTPPRAAPAGRAAPATADRACRGGGRSRRPRGRRDPRKARLASGVVQERRAPR